MHVCGEPDQVGGAPTQKPDLLPPVHGKLQGQGHTPSAQPLTLSHPTAPLTFNRVNEPAAAYAAAGTEGGGGTSGMGIGSDQNDSVCFPIHRPQPGSNAKC